MRYIALVTVVILVAWLILRIRPLHGALIIAGLLAYILNPAVVFLVRRTPLRRVQAVRIVYVLFIVCVVLAGTFLLPLLVRQARVVTGEVQALLLQARTDPDFIIEFRSYTLPIDDAADAISDFLRQELRYERAFRVILSATTNVGYVMIMLFCTYYFLKDGPKLPGWIVQLAPPEYQYDAQRLVDQISRVWYDYLRGQLLLMAIVAVMTTLAVRIIGLRHAILLGLLAGGLDILPNIGPSAAALVAVIVAWFEGSARFPEMPRGVLIALLLAAYFAIQNFETFYLRPRIYGSRLHLHPVLVFVGVIGALMLSGVLLALIIVPLIGSLQVIAGYVQRRISGLPPWPDFEPVVAPVDATDVTAERVLSSDSS